jgi:hypothetical protein
MIISATFSTKTGEYEIKILEIHPYCIESMVQVDSMWKCKTLSGEIVDNMWKCRTLSGEIFFVTQEVHDAIIKKEGGLE